MRRYWGTIIREMDVAPTQGGSVVLVTIVKGVESRNLPRLDRSNSGL